jgi:hypothetical protein
VARIPTDNASVQFVLNYEVIFSLSAAKSSVIRISFDFLLPQQGRYCNQLFLTASVTRRRRSIPLCSSVRILGWTNTTGQRVCITKHTERRYDLISQRHYARRTPSYTRQ